MVDALRYLLSRSSRFRYSRRAEVRKRLGIDAQGTDSLLMSTSERTGSAHFFDMLGTAPLTPHRNTHSLTHSFIRWLRTRSLLTTPLTRPLTHSLAPYALSLHRTTHLLIHSLAPRSTRALSAPRHLLTHLLRSTRALSAPLHSLTH